MIIYTQYLTRRAEFIFSTLFNALGVPHFTLTTDRTTFLNSREAKINYSSNKLVEGAIWIKPITLLFEAGIKEQPIVCFNYNHSKAFFKTAEGDLPFDIFAASFYLISRYEEYLPRTKDMYGRYAHENSIAHKEDFLKLPLVNLWLQEFSQILTKKFPNLKLQPPPFSFLPTYDIDIAFSYLHKGLVRSVGGFIKNMWASEWPLVKERLDVLFRKQEDPFDSYQWMDVLHKEYHLKPIYFFLLANKNKDYDKNIAPRKQPMKILVQKHAGKYEVGIHPSWQSGDNHGLLEQEINTLQNICGKTVTKSRQHYIRMSLPETYRRLINEGIEEDYSMGYGSINGFRASYCLPFKWYDIEKEETTSLTIFPFCYMDANSFYEQHNSCKEALQEMMHYVDIIKQVNGLFITIWHNHFLGTDSMFTGWREVYNFMCQNLASRI